MPAMLFIRISLEMLMLVDLEIIKVIFFFFVISIKTFLLLENGVVSEVTFSEGNDLFKWTSSSGKFFSWQRSALVSVPLSITAVSLPSSSYYLLQDPFPAWNTYNLKVSLS